MKKFLKNKVLKINYIIAWNQSQIFIDNIGSVLQMLDNKLFGLIVPESGNFLPDFYSMLKLMTLKIK